MNEHLQGNNMYIKRESTDKSSSSNWYKRLGAKLAIQVPGTPDQVLATTIKERLQEYTGDNILIVESQGRKLISKLAKSNYKPDNICHRKDCKICINGPTNDKCFQSNIGYRIVCNRSPCSNRLDMEKIDNRNINKQISRLPNNLVMGERPAIYKGETYRSGYNRSKQHWTKYTTKSGQQGSFMFHHTMTDHKGIIGDNKGMTDYRFQITDQYRGNLRRQAGEGERQLMIEEYQTEGKLKVLNSKIDFTKPFKSNLTVLNKNINNVPGQVGVTETDQTRYDRGNTEKKTVSSNSYTNKCTNVSLNRPSTQAEGSRPQTKQTREEKVAPVAEYSREKKNLSPSKRQPDKGQTRDRMRSPKPSFFPPLTSTPTKSNYIRTLMEVDSDMD